MLIRTGKAAGGGNPAYSQSRTADSPGQCGLHGKNVF